MSSDQITINNLSKVFDNGFEALKNINLNIKKGEIFAMLGPNGAGKTTLISIICGIVRPSSGKVTLYDGLTGDKIVCSVIGRFSFFTSPNSSGVHVTNIFGLIPADLILSNKLIVPTALTLK